MNWETGTLSKNADSGKLLRIFIEPGGCSGFEYGMSMDLPKSTDNLGESQGVRFAVDGESVEYLSGTEIHFDDGLIMIDYEVVKTLIINLDIIFARKFIAETGEGHCLPSPERVVP